MWNPRERRRRARATTAIVLTVFSGLVLVPSMALVMGQGTVKPKSGATSAPKPDLSGDLNTAIQLIEKNDYRSFIELYCPVDMLRKLRQQDLVERAATVMANQPKTKPQLLTLLKALQSQSPKFDRSGGLATMEFDSSSGTIEEVPVKLNIPETTGAKSKGLGSDLNRMIAESVKLLEADDIDKFVEGVFPASELALLQSPDARQTLLLQFKETPELAKAMTADFKQMQAIKPELTEKGNVATFTIPKQDERPQRLLKLQKVDSHWRLYDDAPRVILELSRQTKLRPGSAIKVVQMEKIGGNWRFIELPMLRMDGP